MQKNSKIKILVCCHKPTTLPKSNILLPVHVGASLSKFDLPMLKDNALEGATCENISAKNESFCELTALYWAFKHIKKNYPDLEYIGLNHYRRFFAFNSRRVTGSGILKPIEEISKYEIDVHKLEHYLKAGYVVTTPRAHLKSSVAVDYEHAHVSSDLRALHGVVKEIYPEFLDSFNKVFLQSNFFYDCNMFVMPWNEFNAYCTWLFDILFKLEPMLDISRYDKYQKRIFGFMAERLWTVWVTHRKYALKNLNYVMFMENPKVIDDSFVKRLMFYKMRMKDDFAFFLSKLRGEKALERYWIVP